MMISRVTSPVFFSSRRDERRRELRHALGLPHNAPNQLVQQELVALDSLISGQDKVWIQRHSGLLHQLHDGTTGFNATTCTEAWLKTALTRTDLNDHTKPGTFDAYLRHLDLLRRLQAQTNLHDVPPEDMAAELFVRMNPGKEAPSEQRRTLQQLAIDRLRCSSLLPSNIRQKLPTLSGLAKAVKRPSDLLKAFVEKVSLSLDEPHL